MDADRDSAGMVPHSQANCGWFDMWTRGVWSLFEFSLDYYPHDWANEDEHNPVPAPENLTIQHARNFCNLNDATFKERCDGYGLLC